MMEYYADVYLKDVQFIKRIEESETVWDITTKDDEVFRATHLNILDLFSKGHCYAKDR